MSDRPCVRISNENTLKSQFVTVARRHYNKANTKYNFRLIQEKQNAYSDTNMHK